MGNISKSNRRKDIRIPMTKSVMLRRVGEEALIPCDSLDISSGGMFIKMDPPLAFGEKVELIFSILDDDEEIKCVGEVAWARKPEKSRVLPPGIGIRFISIEGKKKDYIKDIVERSLKTQQWIRKTQEDLFQAIIHNMKTPIFSIIGYLDLLPAEANLTPEGERYLEIIKASAYSQLLTINNIINVPRFETDDFETNLCPTKLSNIFNEIARLFESLAKLRNIDFHVIVDEEIYVWADEEKIRDVLINLVSNAIKATSEGSITLKAEPAESYVNVEVSDTGKGIPPDEIDRIFDKFYQASTSRDGVGLGLYIVKSILASHNQEISVSSQEGKGSRFTFGLERAETPEKLCPQA